MENKKEKRVVQIEIDDNVKKLTITGEDKDQQVVMREEINDKDLENVTGGGSYRGERVEIETNCKPIIL